MGKTYEQITDSLVEFIEQQKMFFVATAPLAADGLVNLSPKGYDTLRILDRNTVAYLDLTGSGIETLAHLKENGRMVMMFCAFDGRPNIVRLHGKGTAVENGDPEWDELLEQFPSMPASRAIIKLAVDRIADSCGFSVPRYDFIEDRDQLTRYSQKLSKDELREKQMTNNAASIDGLAGLRAPSV